MSDERWPAYYAVTVDRPAWRTVVRAAELFEADDARSAGGRGTDDDAATGTLPAPADRDGATGTTGLGRFAVDLGCGAGRDARELLRRGWRVLAIDREPAAIEALRAATPAAHRHRLDALVADLAEAAVPAADLVNASISLPFLAPPAFDAAFARALAAVRPGGRFATMLFGDHDESASEPEMTCRPAAWVREALAGFEIEDWAERDEDGQTALGDPHHWHIIEVVARRPESAAAAAR